MVVVELETIQTDRVIIVVVNAYNGGRQLSSTWYGTWYTRYQVLWYQYLVPAGTVW